MSSSKSEPIVNELLAFLQQKLILEGRMDRVSAVQICSSSFTVGDICAAKKVLYESLGIVGTFIPHRRGDEAGVRTLEEVITTLMENEHLVPDFVATGDSNLPSDVPDHVDVSCLLKEIVALKTSVAEILKKFKASENTIAELRQEIVCLRNSAPVTRSPASNFTIIDRHDTGVVLPPSDALVSLPVADAAKSVATAVPPRTCLPRARPVPAASSKPRQRCYADVTARQPVAAKRVIAPLRACEGRDPPKEKTSRTDVDAEGFTLVSKKSRARRAPRKSLCGTAEPVGSGLRVATPSKALYVSRLHHSATVNDVVEYVSKKTGYTLRVFQLKSRHYTHFSSYMIRVPRPLQDTIACADFWPKGVVFRRFRGNLPNPTPGETMQRGHTVVSPK